MSDIPPLMALDEIDRAILVHLQADGRMPSARLAEEIGLSESPCWRRVRRLESEGYITGYRAELNRRRLGLGVFATVEVRFSTHGVDVSQQFETAILDIPNVLTCHNVTGQVDYILTVAAKDLDDYSRITTTLRTLPGVTAVHSSLSLREVKGFTGLPLS